MNRILTVIKIGPIKVEVTTIRTNKDIKTTIKSIILLNNNPSSMISMANLFKNIQPPLIRIDQTINHSIQTYLMIIRIKYSIINDKLNMELTNKINMIRVETKILETISTKKIILTIKTDF